MKWKLNIQLQHKYKIRFLYISKFKKTSKSYFLRIVYKFKNPYKTFLLVCFKDGLSYATKQKVKLLSCKLVFILYNT